MEIMNDGDADGVEEFKFTEPNSYAMADEISAMIIINIRLKLD